MVAGRELTPKDAKNTARLKVYWAFGDGAKLIRWDTPGDFDRCVLEVQKAVTEGGRKPLPDRMIKGLCANLHKMATGAPPGHGPREQAAAAEKPKGR